VRIEAVEFADFRNYSALSFSPAPRLNVLTGLNAQGKSNLLEGLAVLVVGRSFRGARAAEMTRWGMPLASVSGELKRSESSRALRRVIAPREDGAWSVTGEGCSWARAIPFTWADLAVVNGGPQARRSFLDGFVAKVYPAYAATYQRYRRVLARRNHLLQERGDLSRLRVRLEPWNAQLAELALEILARRRRGVEALAREVARLYPALGGRGVVGLEYRSALGPAPTAEEVQRALLARLGEEVRRGQTLVGPHRDDVLVLVDERDVRSFGSRGQQRLIALTLRLAEAGPVEEAVGSPPVLLLDDALSELDPGVQARVLDHVSRAGQVFLTSADATLPDICDARWWEVKGGGVTDSRLVAVRGAA
jgi:DNA replication and repair protein RecF